MPVDIYLSIYIYIYRERDIERERERERDTYTYIYTDACTQIYILIHKYLYKCIYLNI